MYHRVGQIEFMDTKMATNIYFQHITKMYFDRNFKLKPNHLQILIIRHGVKKVVHPVYKKAEIIKNDEWCMAEVKFWQ
jgi:hypothetical protein